MVLPDVACLALFSQSLDLAFWAECVPSIVCLALCSQNFGPAVCIRCVYALQSCEPSVVFPETGPGLGCLPGCV